MYTKIFQTALFWKARAVLFFCLDAMPNRKYAELVKLHFFKDVRKLQDVALMMNYSYAWVRKFKPKAMSQFYEVWGMEFPKAYDKIQTDLYKEIFLKDTEKACGWKPKEAPEAVTNGYKLLSDVCNRLI